MSRQRQRPRQNPTLWRGLVGLVAILALAVLVFVSYRANDGVPGASYHEIYVDVPDANRLVRNNQVRIAGVRVGQILEIEAVTARGGAQPHGRLRVQLEHDAPPVRPDSTATVRPASVLGSTYLDLVPGKTGAPLPHGDVLALGQARENVELTDLMDVFDRPTVAAIQQGTTELGGGLVGRGPDVNEALRHVNGLVPRATRLLEAMSAESARLREIIAAYDGMIAPFRAEQDALTGFLTHGARTFTALDEVRAEFERTVEVIPASFGAAERAFGQLNPGLRSLTRVSRRLRTASEELPGALANTNRLLASAGPWLREVPRTAERLQPTAGRLEAFARLPQTEGAIRRTGDTMAAMGGLLEALTPAQTACNYVTLFGQAWRNNFGRNGIGDGPPIGNAQIAKLGISPLEVIQNRTPLPGLHTNYTPNADDTECEAGNEVWDGSRQRFTNPPGKQARATYATKTKPFILDRARRAGLLEAPPTGTKR